MDLNSIVTRTPDAAFRIYDGEATIVLPGRAEVKVLNRIGSLVWDRIDGRRALSEILQAVLDEYDVPREQAERDLLEFVGQLHDSGMVS